MKKYSQQAQEIDNRYWNIKCVRVEEGESRDNEKS